MNAELKEEVISMAKRDSGVLRALIDSGELGAVDYHPEMKAVHEKHNKRIKAIVAEYGWPGISLVGREGAEAAWYIVQHAVLDQEFMRRCLPLLETAVKHGEAQPIHFAYLQDRVLTMSGKPQIYGTQHDVDGNGKAYPLPVQDPGRVDRLREAMGLEPLAEATRSIQERHDKVLSAGKTAPPFRHQATRN